MRDAIPTIDDQCAHRTWLGLLFSVHEMIDHQRTIRAGKKLAQTNRPDWRVTAVQGRRTFLEYIILNDRALGKPPAKFGDPFALAHQLDLSEAKRVSPSDVVGGLVSQVRLS